MTADSSNAEPPVDESATDSDLPWHVRATQDAAEHNNTRLYTALIVMVLAIAVLVSYMATTGYVSERAKTDAPDLMPVTAPTGQPAAEPDPARP